MVLEDTRKMTEAEADAALAKLAEHEASVTETLARYERKINALKEEAEAKVKAHNEAIESLAEKLRKYVDGNRGAFAKPRARQTAFGQYGLRKVSNVEADDLERALKFGLRHRKLGLVVVKPSLDKKAARTLIEAGTKIPGLHLSTGDETFYKVSKDLLDNAKKKALGD